MKDNKKSVYKLKIEAKKKWLEIVTGREKNLKSYRNLRREIAKILTLKKNEEILERIKKEGVNK